MHGLVRDRSKRLRSDNAGRTLINVQDSHFEGAFGNKSDPGIEELRIKEWTGDLGKLGCQRS